MSTYSYCASGDTLTVTPQMSSLTGTVVLQREGTGGAGGAGGTGGGGTGGGGTGGAAAERHGRCRNGRAGTGGSSGAGGSVGGNKPCDIYAAGQRHVRGGAQHGPCSVQGVQGQSLSGQARGRHARDIPVFRRRLRGLRSAGVVLMAAAPAPSGGCTTKAGTITSWKRRRPPVRWVATAA